MKVEILASTIALNRIVHPGELLDLNPKDGRFLIALGKAAEILEMPPEYEEEIISDEVRVRRRARRP